VTARPTDLALGAALACVPITVGAAVVLLVLTGAVVRVGWQRVIAP